MAIPAPLFESNGNVDLVTGATSGPLTFRVLRGNATGLKRPAVFEGTIAGAPEGLFVGA